MRRALLPCFFLSGGGPHIAVDGVLETFVLICSGMKPDHLFRTLRQLFKLLLMLSNRHGRALNEIKIDSKLDSLANHISNLLVKKVHLGLATVVLFGASLAKWRDDYRELPHLL